MVERIFFIRHGETVDNAARVVQKPNSPLSAKGLRQAELLGARLAGEGITHILSSDFPRAAVTAEFLGRATRATIQYEPLLQERNFGDIRGTAYAELDFDMFARDYHP